MNLILTTSCNKGCPYCFATSVREEYGKSVMDMETFNTLLDKIENSKNSRAKLLGGEPTLHPQFVEFLDEIIKRKVPTTLISNFLFSDKVRDKIIEAIKHVPIDFLVNATNLDEKNLIDIWSENYNHIY
ncbi:MAG: radical SAM protein, partial [archaeon]